MIEVRPYAETLSEAWDKLCLQSPNGTFLHTRRYLAHQKNRFQDRSLMIFSEGRLLAVLPAAESTDDPHVVVSHPGLTYGGLVTAGSPGATSIARFMPEVFAIFQKFGYRKFVYKPTPTIYQRKPSEDDSFVLIRMGATLSRVQLNCVVDLMKPSHVSSRKKRNLKKAIGLALVQDDSTLIADYFEILTKNLTQRHDVRPVHTLSEMMYLQNTFTKEFGLYFAQIDNQSVGGVIVFRTENCWHAQYVAMSDRGSKLGAVDFTLCAAIEDARRSGASYFSLGVSTDPVTNELNDSLYDFKREFDGSGLIQKTWAMNL